MCDKMIPLKHTFLYLFLIIAVASCYPPEEFPNTPSIAFNDLKYREIDNGTDSLILTIDFQDGDGDIGLDGDENFYPYHDFNAIIDANNKFVTISDTEVEPPFYIATPNGDISFFSQTDNRPDYNCLDYEIVNLDEANTQVDTFYVQQNENNKNIFVDFYRKKNGVYEFIDWTRVFSAIGCGTTFDARFPRFIENNNDRALDGSITYSMVSEGFGLVLRSDTFQLRVRIKDRALNDSNEIRSPDFTLSELQQ